MGESTKQCQKSNRKGKDGGAGREDSMEEDRVENKERDREEHRERKRERNNDSERCKYLNSRTKKKTEATEK